METMEVLKLNPIKQLGPVKEIVDMFGGKAGYEKAVKELEEDLYKSAQFCTFRYYTNGYNVYRIMKQLKDSDTSEIKKNMQEKLGH